MKNAAEPILDPLPHMRPSIRLSPFVPREWEKLLESKVTRASRTCDRPSFWLDGGRSIKYYASGRSALFACLKHLKLKRSDTVMIVKTTDGPYVSRCVTETIKKVCRWEILSGHKSHVTRHKVKLILVIHEFGFPCPEWKVAPFKKKGIPILEDCAYALGSRIEGAKVGTFGDYALYSLPKYFPMPFGGILAALSAIKHSGLELKATGENLVRQTIHASYPHLYKWNTLRRENWSRFNYDLAPSGFAPYFSLPKNVVPGVYLTAVPRRFKGEKVKTKLNKAGVESTQYYKQGGFYFPVHQFLTIWEKEYIVRNF